MNNEKKKKKRRVMYEEKKIVYYDNNIYTYNVISVFFITICSQLYMEGAQAPWCENTSSSVIYSDGKTL